MRDYAKHVMLSALMLVALTGAAVAGPFEDGLAAAKGGDYATALRLWRPLADQGDANAQYNLGLTYEKGWGVQQNYMEALRWYRRAANQGNATAQDNLGSMYANGQGVSQDYAKAVKLYRLAADQGDALGQSNLGLAYYWGQGVPQNYIEAMKWCHRAADQGNATGQFVVGVMYYRGQGVSQDYAEAMKSYRLAADQGDAKAQNNLALMYQEGEGVPQSYTEAAKWYRRSADQGNAAAQYALGNMYYVGRGVPQDYVRAFMWSNLSAAQGNQDAEKNRGIIAQHMADTQIAEAQELSRDWKSQSPPNSGFLPNPSSQAEVPLKQDGGVFVVPVQINGAITLEFMIDSGASVVSMPADVFSTLTRTGTIRDTDIIGTETYVLADGSKTQAATFTIRSLKVGSIVVENVLGSVAPAQGSLLLGQSFLEHFKSWSIDNTKHELMLEAR